MADGLEIGQFIFGNPTGSHGMPKAADALLAGVLNEIARVFWNTNQRQWDRHEDPKIPGLEFRPYFWGDDETEAAKPNLAHNGVEVRWYKHPGRGTSVNRAMTPAEWFDWFSACVECVRRAERE